MARYSVWLGILVCPFAGTGCSTAHAVAANCPFPNQIYGGVRTELDTIDFFNMEHYLDVPFSALADTLVLPYTIPRTFYNYAHPETRPCYEDWWDDVWLDHRYLADCRGSSKPSPEHHAVRIGGAPRGH